MTSGYSTLLKIGVVRVNLLNFWNEWMNEVKRSMSLKVWYRLIDWHPGFNQNTKYNRGLDSSLYVSLGKLPFNFYTNNQDRYTPVPDDWGCRMNEEPSSSSFSLSGWDGKSRGKKFVLKFCLFFLHLTLNFLLYIYIRISMRLILL